MSCLKFMRMPILFLMVSLMPQSVLAKNGLRDWVLDSWEDILHIHFYGAREVERRRSLNWREVAPKNWDMLISVKPTGDNYWRGKNLRCSDLKPVSFRDWYSKRGKKENGMWLVTAFSHWSSPAYFKISTTKKYLVMDDWPVHISMAVIGNAFDIRHILSDHGGQVSENTFREMAKLNKYKFYKPEHFYMYGRNIKLLQKKNCDGFRIFDFEVSDRD